MLAPNLAMAYGLYDARVYDPLSVRRFVALATVLGERQLGKTSISPIYGTAEPVPGLNRVASIACLWHEDGRGGVALARRPESLPRAYVAPGVRTVTAEAALLLLASGLDPGRATLIEDKTARGQRAGESLRVAKLLEYAPHRVTVEAESEHAGWLVITDVHYPGWRATVNGRPAKIAIANYAFRGIPIPAGRSQVVLTFEPDSYRVGLFVGLLSAAMMAAILGGHLARHGRRRPGPAAG